VEDDEGWNVREVLARVAGTVVAVPVVLGLIALGGVVVVGRTARDVAGRALASRDGRPRRRRRGRDVPSSSPSGGTGFR
jgi:hypothetical protein